MQEVESRQYYDFQYCVGIEYKTAFKLDLSFDLLIKNLRIKEQQYEIYLNQFKNKSVSKMLQEGYNQFMRTNRTNNQTNETEMKQVLKSK